VKPNTPPHSLPVPPSTLTTCAVTVVPILDNNYAYLLVDKATRNAAVVDPADPYAVLRAVQAANVTLTHILTTHHHHDHAGARAGRGTRAGGRAGGARGGSGLAARAQTLTLRACTHAHARACRTLRSPVRVPPPAAGGNTQLVRHVRAAEGRQLVVVGGRRDSVPGCTLALGDGDTLCVGSTTLRVLETPCHTRGHVLFCVLSGPAASAGNGGGGPLSLQRRNASSAGCDNGNHASAPAAGCCGIGAAAVAAAAPGALPSARDADVEAVFSGDTVFVGGVGAFFHGNAADMERNLNGRMAGLPDGALLFCGHEYTTDNMRFAAWLEPDNTEVVAKYLAANAKRAAGEPTVPSTMGAERRANPYFRTRDAALQAAVASRAAWVERRRARSYGQRAWDAVAGRPAQPPHGGDAKAAAARRAGGEEALSMTPVQLYRALQELLSFGAWQSFKLNAAAASAVRRRAAHNAAQAAGARAQAAVAAAAAAAAADRA
jgi:glyoxylase-like metal-dependent hydrolase (beta-lactamase superfamily II)